MWKRFTVQIATFVLFLLTTIVVAGGYGIRELEGIMLHPDQISRLVDLQRFTYVFLLLIVIVTVGFLVNVVLVYHFSLKTVLNAIDRFTRGDVGYRIPLVSKNEFGIIAAYINKAMDVLEKTKRTVEAARKKVALINETLEQRVMERTHDLEISVEKLKRSREEEQKSLVRIKELNDLRVKFVQVVSHQLRTPLNSIRWNLELLMSDEMGKLKESQKEFIRATHDMDVEVIRRVHDMLTALDIEENRVSLVKTQTSIESLWGSVMVDVKKQCVIKELTCTSHLPSTALPLLDVDAEKIRDVFVRLMDNAVTFTAEKGTITATLSQTGNRMRFQVTDTGVGIPTAEQPRIFTRFFRASNAAAMKTDSSGLGLSIAKYYVEQHGGTIGFTSTEGKGSTFWFELPLNGKG